MSLPRTGFRHPTRAAAGKEYTHTVSLRQSNADYRRLARFCADESDRTGQRVTKQMIIETALARYLDERGG